MFDIDIIYFFIIENTKDFIFLGGNRICLFLYFFSEIDFLYFSFCKISKFAILIVLVQISCLLRPNCTANNNQTKRYSFNMNWCLFKWTIVYVNLIWTIVNNMNYSTVALVLAINNCNCEFSFVIIVHYEETEQIELKVKTKVCK